MAGQRSTATVEDRPAAPDGGVGDAKPLRADARRNYERLVTAAKQVFSEQGGGASMEAIARQAGVGVGTLYRHFPKRIDVVEAVYRTDVDTLVLAAEAAADEADAWDGLVHWLEAFVAYGQGKRTFLNELHEAFDKNPDLRSSCRERVNAAMQLVIERGQLAGVVRTDVDGPDVMQLVAPMCTSATITGEQAHRLLGMVLDGLRPPA